MTVLTAAVLVRVGNVLICLAVFWLLGRVFGRRP